MKYKKYIYLGLVILCFVIISSFSNANSNSSNKTSKALINRVIVIYEKISSKKVDRKELIDNLNPIVRKIAHFTLFFILGISVFLFIDSIGINKRILISIIICILLASIDETHQLFTSGRTGRVFDIIVDTSGSICSILLFNIKNKKRGVINDINI